MASEIGGIYYGAIFHRRALAVFSFFPPMSSSQDIIMSEPGDLPLTPLTESQIEDIVDLTTTPDTTTLAYMPSIIKGKGSMGLQVKLWHVDTSKVCVDLCKSQLKVLTLSNQTDI